MVFLPQAVTAAVAHCAAGHWQLPGGLPPPWRAAEVVAGGYGQLPVMAIAAPLKNNLTSDRACNLAIDLAGDLAAVAPWLAEYRPDQVGVCVTVSKGGIGPWMEQARPAGELTPALLDILPPDAAGGFVAATAGWRGPRLTPVAACATGVANLAGAARLLAADGLRAVICGGSESSLHPAVLASMARMGILDAAPMRPFDQHQAGFNLGEGGALVALEPCSRWPDRRPLAYLTGAWLVADGHHLTELHPTRGTLTRVLRRIFSDRAPKHPVAGRAPELTSLYVNAHATATAVNDGWESEQLISAFGQDGWARREGWVAASAPVVVSGTKSMTGHLLGGSGALEAVICLLVLQGAPVPPTFRLCQPRDPWPAAMQACKQLYLLGDPAVCPGWPGAQPPAAALSLNYGFGGHVGGLLFEREIAR